MWSDTMNNKNIKNKPISTVEFPVDFIKDMSKANSIQEVFDIAADWLPSIVEADRASITLADSTDPEHLKIYSLQGEQAVPLHTAVPVKGSLPGECFTRCKVVYHDFSDKQEQSLYEAGLKCGLAAPMISGNRCYGTLNVAHRSESYYCENHGLIMECIAGWLASHIRILDKAQKSQTLANTDYLTGLLNRRSFMNKAAQHLQDFQSTEKTFALALLDIDHFKAINDTYGHDTGDLVLKDVAGVLKSLVREADLVARFGGEEFIILFDSVNEEKFIKLVNHCQQGMTEIQVPFQGSTLDVGISIGLTSCGMGDTLLETVINRADVLLYKAKHNGRKQVQFDAYVSDESEAQPCEAVV